MSVDTAEARDELLVVLGEFLAKREDSLAAAPAPFQLDREWWHQFTEMGVFGVALSEEQGGLGLGLDDLARVFEVLGEKRAPGPLVWTQLAALIDPSIALDGHVVAGVDMTILQPGDSVFVPHVEGADRLIVLWADAVRIFDTADFECTPMPSPIDPETPVARIGWLPEADPVGDGEVAQRLRRVGGLLNAALMLGISQAAIDIAVDYAKQRHQFGRPIGSFQALKHLLADSYARTNLARAAVYAAAELEQAGADPDGFDLRSAQLLCGKAADKNARTAVQVFGGMGFAWETAPHRLLKRTWLLEHEFGTVGAHELAVAKILGGGARG